MTMPSPLLPILAAHPPLTTRPSTADLSAPTVHHFVGLNRPRPSMDPGIPSLVQWHPTRPILCTMNDVAWWDVNGALLTRICNKGSGMWSQQGSVFWSYGRPPHDHDSTSRIVSCDDFHTQTRTTLSMGTTPIVPWITPHPYERLAAVSVAHAASLCQVGLWDSTKGTVQMLPGARWKLNMLRWSPDGTMLCGITQNPDTRHYTIHWLDRDGTLRTHRHLSTNYVWTLSWSPDSRCIIIQGGDEMFWWDIITDRFRQFAHGGVPPTYEYLKWNPTEPLIAVIVSGALVFFDYTGTPVRELRAPNRHSIINCTWHPISSDLMVATMNGVLYWWDQHTTLICEAPLTHPDMPVLGRPCSPFSLAWDSTGTYLAAGLYDRTVQIYRLGEERAP